MVAREVVGMSQDEAEWMVVRVRMERMIANMIQVMTEQLFVWCQCWMDDRSFIGFYGPSIDAPVENPRFGTACGRCAQLHKAYVRSRIQTRN